jgi:hypothetical protein
MILPDSNNTFRRALNLEGLNADEHRRQIEQIRLIHPHSIRFVRSRPDETCVVHSLRLTDQSTYRAIATDFDDVFAGRKFIIRAINRSLSELDGPQVGCLIAYFVSAEWQHVGVVKAAGRAASKWGTYPLYEHGFAEVPDTYGNEVRFFARPTESDALALFVDFAHESGLDDDDIASAIRRSAAS